MNPLSLIVLLALAVMTPLRPAIAQPEPTPCFDCRTSECPSLQAPPCPGSTAKKKSPSRRPVAKSVSPAPPSPAPPAAPSPVLDVPPPAPAPVLVALTPPPRPPVSLRPWKWTALGVGLGLSGIGAALLAVDGTLSDCTQPGVPGSCGQVLHSKAGGAALVGVGGAALVGAVVLFVLDARRAR